MATPLEKETILSPGEQDIVVRPETLSEKIEKIAPGIQVTQTQFKSQVNDSQGMPLISTPETKEVVVELPRSEDILVQESKGNIDDSKTWLAKFFLRLIEKARHFGWQVVSLAKTKIGGGVNA
jgi:hypothetical protein